MSAWDHLMGPDGDALLFDEETADAVANELGHALGSVVVYFSLLALVSCGTMLSTNLSSG